MATNSSIQQNLIPNEPHLLDLLNLFKKQLLLDFSAHHVGTIQSFNSANQTAQVTINYKKTFFTFNPTTFVYDPTLVDYPIIAEAPVIFLGGGKTSLTFPVVQGDECLVLFNDRDLDNWFSGGSGSPNGTARLHNFADAIVLVGIRSLANVLTSFDSARAVLQNGTTLVGVGTSLIKIANNEFTLGAVLQNLITAINNLISALTTNASTFILVTGAPTTPSPINPAIVTALASVTASLIVVSTDLTELLE